MIKEITTNGFCKTALKKTFPMLLSFFATENAAEVSLAWLNR